MNIREARALIAAEFAAFVGFKATPDDATLAHLARGLRAGLIDLAGVRAEFSRLARHASEMSDLRNNHI